MTTAACYVYVLGSTGKGGHRTYVGWTTDIEQRLARHNDGTGARSTRGRVWFLLYAERHADRRAAMSREWHLKRDRAFRKMIAADLAAAIKSPTANRSAPSRDRKGASRRRPSR